MRLARLFPGFGHATTAGERDIRSSPAFYSARVPSEDVRRIVVCGALSARGFPGHEVKPGKPARLRLALSVYLRRTCRFFGDVLTAPRSVPSNPRFKFCQEPLRGLANRFHALSCAVAVHEQQRTERPCVVCAKNLSHWSTRS